MRLLTIALLSSVIAAVVLVTARERAAGLPRIEFGQCPIVFGTVAPSLIVSINPTAANTVDEVKVYVEARDDWTLVSALPSGQRIDYAIGMDTEHVLSIFDDGNNRKIEIRNRFGTGPHTQLRARPVANDRGDSNLSIHVLATSDDEHKLAVQYGGMSELLTFRRPN